MPRRARQNTTRTEVALEIPSNAAAGYLADLLPELVRVADRGGLEVVAYLLEMARIEVEQTNIASDKRRL